MKKVLFLDPLSYTGMAYYSYSFVETMTRMGCDVTYVCSDGWLLESKERSFKVLRLYRGTTGERQKWIKGLAFVISCYRVFFHAVTGKYDIVHFQQLEVPAVELFLAVVLKLCGIQVFMTVHEIEDPKGSRLASVLIQSTLREGTRIIAHNMATRERLLALGISPSRIILMAHGGYEYFVGPSLQKTEYRGRIGLEHDKQYVLCFGSLSERKGVPVLLSAMDILINTNHVRDVRLLIVGKPVSTYDVTKDIQFVKQKGLSNVVTFRSEFVSDDFIEGYFRGSDIVVIPYVHICESGVLRHAMSFGSTVVVSNLKEFSDIAIDHLNCVLFQPGDSVDLASKLLLLLSDKDRQAMLGRNAEDTMVSKYTWNKVVQGIRSYY